MTNPKITVIIPTRERCDVLGKTLATVVAQDYEAIEILVSDNFSADETRATGIEARPSAEWLARVLRGRASYPALPMLYNGGFVAHKVIARIRDVTGSVYRSSIPDVYAAVAIASVTQTYLFSHAPLAING